jgi:UDP-GlcNAc:undecaprenyl-phosphate/decaprenyl-phosphate GlcNAc-1-phosphate transferase
MESSLYNLITQTGFVSITSILIAFFVSFVITGLMVKVAIPDVPDHKRKQHRAPNPTAGGVGILAGMIAAGVFNRLFMGVTTEFVADLTPWMWFLTVATGPFVFLIPMLAGAIGFADDVRDLKPRVKLFLLTLLSGFSIYQFGWFEEIWFSQNTILILPAVLGICGTLLWYLVIINTVNFVDGSNGLAMSSVAIGLIGVSMLRASSITGVFLDPNAFLMNDSTNWVIAAIVGFLFWNAPSGKIFAGDTGALAVGITIAWASVGMADRVGVWIVVICFLPMLVDVILTVVWRATKRQQLTTAHAHHAYQVLLRAGLSHGKVAVIYCCLTATCIIAGHFGIVTTQGEVREDIWLGSFIAFLVMLAFLCGCYAFVRHHAAKSGLNEAPTAEIVG